jgi:hypothetical protein
VPSAYRPEEELTEMVCIRMPVALHSAASTVATRGDTTFSQLVRRLLREHLESVAAVE